MGKKNKKKKRKKQKSSRQPAKAAVSTPKVEAPKVSRPTAPEPLSKHKHKATDPDDWEMKLEQGMAWVKENSTAVLLVVVALLAVVGLWLSRSEAQQAREMQIWVELETARDFAQRTGYARIGLDSLQAVVERYRGTKGWDVVGLSYASALLESGDSASVVEATAMLDRLNAGSQATPSQELAQRMLSGLRTRSAERTALDNRIAEALAQRSGSTIPPEAPEEPAPEAPEEPAPEAPEEPAPEAPEEPAPADSLEVPAVPETPSDSSGG